VRNRIVLLYKYMKGIWIVFSW